LLCRPVAGSTSENGRKLWLPPESKEETPMEGMLTKHSRTLQLIA
jgi:hypothetical protein